LLILRVLVRENWHRREAPGVASRGFKVPRCSRILLASRLVAGALVTALVLTGGQVRGQQAALPQGGDADANLLAPTLDGDPKKPPRFRARRSNDESDGMLFRQPRRLRAVLASGARSTGFDSSNGSLRQGGSEPDPGTIPTAAGTVTTSPGKSAAKSKRRERYVASIGLSYLLTRDVWLKGEFRQEWEQANVAGSNYVASVWLLGVRLQR
jgi:hypothetical protein